MSRDRQRGFAVSLLLPGLLVLLMGLGGSWGSAYGQSGGPAPTPEAGPPLPNAVQPVVGGAEGEAPASGRPEAVAGESGVADEASAGEVSASGRPEAVAGESGVLDTTVEGTPSLIASTGAASGMQWSLLLAGMLLLAGGGVMFARARQT